VIKAHDTHIWKYHNETSLINYANKKVKNKNK
jgi:hypothetical protein